MVQDRRVDVPKSFHVKLPPDLREWLRRRAFRQDIAMAEVIRQLVEKAKEEEPEEGQES
jgi:hypothetical protein